MEGRGHENEIMINDVSRAYFYAKASRNLFVEIPSEDPLKKPGMIGRLKLCLYGTRDAAKTWQETLSAQLVTIGFVRGKGHTAVYHHKMYGIMTLVHGDDYYSAGPRSNLLWLKAKFTEAYEIKSQHVGNHKECVKEGKVLNRVIRCTESGFELEADQRHAELVVEQMSDYANGTITSPGIDTAEAGKDKKTQNN